MRSPEPISAKVIFAAFLISVSPGGMRKTGVFSAEDTATVPPRSSRNMMRRLAVSTDVAWPITWFLAGLGVVGWACTEAWYRQKTSAEAVYTFLMRSPQQFRVVRYRAFACRERLQLIAGEGRAKV